MLDKLVNVINPMPCETALFWHVPIQGELDATWYKLYSCRDDKDCTK